MGERDYKSTAGGATQRHIKSLDGLRGLAALIVVGSHFGNYTGTALLDRGAGQLGVMLFFCLSGFLMARLYFDRPCTASSVTTFFQHRAARVLPLFYVVVLASYTLQKSLGTSGWSFSPSEGDVLRHLLTREGDGVFWTVPVELHFYLLVPLLWWLRQRLPSKLFGVAGLAAIASTFAYLNIWCDKIQSLVSVIHFFVAGMLISVLWRPPARANMNGLFAVSLLSLFLLYPRLHTDSSDLQAIQLSVWSNPIYLLVVASLIISSISSPLASLIFGSRPFRFVGQISYSIYLLHMPIMENIGPIIMENMPIGIPYAFRILFGLASVVLIFVLSAASFHLIERPLRSAVNDFRLDTPSARRIHDVIQRHPKSPIGQKRLL